MGIKRERFGVLETEISESIEKLKEAIRLENDLQRGKEKRRCIYFRLNSTSNTLKEVKLELEQEPTQEMKEFQTTLESQVNDIGDQLNQNLHEISTAERKLNDDGLSQSTERLVSQIQEAIGIVHDEEILQVEKMHQQSQIRIRVLEENAQKNEAEISKLRSENQNLKAVMQKIRHHLDYSHSTDDSFGSS